MSAILFSRSIGPVSIDCVVSEKPLSVIEVSEVPIESGAVITDHAYIHPKKLSLDIANYDIAESYRAIIELQEGRAPFTVVTGLSVFENMLIKSVEVERDASYSNVMRAKVELQEVIIVETAYDPTAGRNGTRSKGVSSGKSKDASTSDKAAQTNNRGDTGGNAATARDRSIASQIFGGD